MLIVDRRSVMLGPQGRCPNLYLPLGFFLSIFKSWFWSGYSKTGSRFKNKSKHKSARDLYKICFTQKSAHICVLGPEPFICFVPQVSDTRV